MKKIFLQIPGLALCASLALVSCSTMSNTNKHSSETNNNKNVGGSNQKTDEAELEKLRTEIKAEIAKVKCTEATLGDWKSAPMGSKSCGGPRSYIAYPKILEASVLPKIEQYSAKENEFNKKYNISSDCSFISEPKGIVCNGDGTAMAIYAVE